MARNFLTAIDIGSQSIKAGIAEVKHDGHIALLKTFKMPSAGMRKGVIDDIGEATRAVSHVIAEIKKFDRAAGKNIMLSLGGSDVKIQSSKGIVAVSRADSEIQKDDIDRAVEASLALKLPRNRIILHSLTKEFIVDDVGDIRDPLGMIGNRLEVSSLIIDAFEPNVKTVTRAVETSGGAIHGLVFSPLASANSCLTKNQKDLGVVLLDIGFGKTGMAVYEEGKLLHAKVFPFGAGNITNDLAIGLRVGIHAAENIKMSLGMAIAKEAPSREMVDLRKFDPTAKKQIARRFLAEVIEDRLAEMFEFVDNELKSIGRSAKLPGGVVLTGGGSKIPLIVELAKSELRLSAQIGLTDLSRLEVMSPDIAEAAEDPEMASVIGLILWDFDGVESSDASAHSGPGFLKRFFRNFIP